MASSVTTTREGNIWLLKARRSLGDHEATGQVMVKAEHYIDPSTAPHGALAGAQAWLILGKKLLAAGHAEQAIECAEGGLAELGNSYESPMTKDDTGLKLELAHDRINSGRVSEGAYIMLRALESRIDIYERKHSEALGDQRKVGTEQCLTP